MPQYPPYTTTVIGAHSVPRWYEALDRLVSLGQLGEGDLVDAQLRASQAAILEQEIAGIDVITGGEMHRRRHNQHSPPNAMLNYFWRAGGRGRKRDWRFCLGCFEPGLGLESASRGPFWFQRRERAWIVRGMAAGCLR